MSPARRLIVWLIGAVVVWAAAAPVGAQTLGGLGGAEHRARGAFDRGEYVDARRLAEHHDDPDSLVIRSRLAAYQGDLKLAIRFARAAVDRSTGNLESSRAHARLGHLLKASGHWKQAESQLRAYLSDHPRAHAVRLQLGRLLIAAGNNAEGVELLDVFSRFFNNGQLDTSRQLRLLGEAMWATGSFQDANFAFKKMYAKDPKYGAGLVAWGRLLGSKYNSADAKRTLQEALDVNDKNPAALVAMARLEMQTKNYFDDARAFLDRAEQVAPAYPPMLITRAKLAVYDSDCTRAANTADAILDRRPRYLDAYVIKAACRYLNDDQAGFEAIARQALAIKPDFARLYTATAEYAKLAHRYVEIVDLNRKALALKPEYGPALLGLGIGLTRIGREDAGVRAVKKAFQADPYNRRAYNVVELYDKKLPDYDLTAYDKFKLRTHHKQTAPLNRMVPAVVRAAMATYEAKYHYEARDQLAVEMYPNPATFGVRSVGLPNISPHGVCFGRLVITRSPSDANFNWRQVLWHEMAHVYHIQKADYRVPRWFTEGLAEYETNVKDPAWIRHHDRQIVAMMRQDDLPSVTELDQRFTRARSFKEILRAYQLSSLVIHFIVDEHGFEAVNDMLDTFADKLKTGPTIKAALGEDVDTFDRKLEQWLEARYSNFNDQFVVSIDAIPAERTLEKEVAAHPKDAVARAKLAVGRLRADHPEEATRAIERALELDADDPTVRYLAGFVALNQGRTRDAYDHGQAVIDDLEDGYEVRVMLGHAAMMLEKPKAARVHLVAATQLYRDGAEAWKDLRKLGESQGDEALAERAEKRLFDLDQNNPLVARQRMNRMIDHDRLDAAMDAAKRWVAIQPLEARAQRAVARVSLKINRPKRAARAYEVLVDISSDQQKAVLREAASAFEAAGFSAQASKFAGRAREMTAK